MSNTNESMKIFDIIAEIEDVIEEAPKPKLGGGNKRLIEADELYDILGDLKVTIPEDVRRANSILIDAQKMIDNAEEHARDIVENAENTVENMLREAENRVSQMHAQAQREYEQKVSENEIYQEAQKRARLLAMKAEHNSQVVYNSAKSYADEVLADVQRFLGEYQSMLETNRSDLGAYRQPDFSAQAVSLEEEHTPTEKTADIPVVKRKAPVAAPVRQTHPEEEEDEDEDDDEEDEEEERGGGLFGWFKKRRAQRDEEYDEDDEDEEDEDETEEEEDESLFERKPRRGFVRRRGRKDDVEDEEDEDEEE